MLRAWVVRSRGNRQPHAASTAQIVRRICLLLMIAAGPSALPFDTVSALDPASQSQASKAQIEKLSGMLQQHFAGADSLMERRSAFEELMASTPGPSRVQIRHVDAGGVDAELIWPARLHHPIGRRAILYVHGGGFYGGSLQTHRAFAAALAKASSSDVLLINYRLAPDYPFPAPIDDTLTAYQWLLESGYDNDNVVIAGDAAGGNLAIEATLRQMQLKGPLPAAVIAVSPITDLAGTGNSFAANIKSDPLLNATQMEAARKAYLGSRAPTDPRASPLYADMTGFPPILMQVGSSEALLDDTLRLADKARKAGVDVTAEVWPGMIHQWQLFPFWIDDARRSNQNMAEYAIQHFADKPKE
ncbi:alpha/beta hydrolase [Rhizobium sp. S96]|nr:alpha/beta hydrolase [Rhizobium sp. S96]